MKAKTCFGFLNLKKNSQRDNLTMWIFMMIVFFLRKLKRPMKVLIYACYGERYIFKTNLTRQNIMFFSFQERIDVFKALALLCVTLPIRPHVAWQIKKSTNWIEVMVSFVAGPEIRVNQQMPNGESRMRFFFNLPGFFEQKVAVRVNLLSFFH